MKFKLRADPEDWLIFFGFALALLYVISIAVVDLATFASEGHLPAFPLNPFPAFSSEYIGSTIIIYVLVLAALFLSVGSYFFEREKGFGITTEKKDKGYSRWAKDKEIQEELKCVQITQKNAKSAGVPIIVNEKEMWVDDSEYHSLIIGATGSGKTQGIVFPQVNSLAKARESMIITDPKGEIYENTSIMLRQRGYQILLLNFRDPQSGNAWNPMTLPYKMFKSGNQDKAIELLDDLALNILYDDSNKNADPFWEKTSADYFSGVALGLFEDAKPEEININSISLATTVGEEKFGGSTYIKEYFAGKDPNSAAAINASSTIMAPTETKGSILSVFKQKVKLFASRENLSEMLSYSDIDLNSIGERPTAVFIVIQDEKKTYHSLVTILLKQIYETLISTAQRHGGKLPVRTNFILDEFANMPPLKDVTTMITAARSRRIRFTMIIQNFAQLDGVYGKDDAETIRGNCGNIIYLITTELKALEEISKMCGEVKSKKDDKTASTPLVTVSDLQRMKQYETIILRMRKQPFKTKLIPNYKLKWGMKYPLAKYPTRKKREVKTFDIKEYVKNQKKKKLLEMMNGGAPADEGGSAKSDLLPKMNPADFMKKTAPIPPTSRPETRPQNMLRDELPKPSTEKKLPDFLTRTPFDDDDDDEDFGVFKSSTKEPPMGGFRPKSLDESRKKPEPIVKKEEQDDDLGFDVDELVKKIDAKIAELEEEEKRSKQADTKKETKMFEPVSKPKNDLPKTEKDIEEILFEDEEDNKPKEPKLFESISKPKETNIFESISKPKNDIPVVRKTQEFDDFDDDDDFEDILFGPVSKPEKKPVEKQEVKVEIKEEKQEEKKTEDKFDIEDIKKELLKSIDAKIDEKVEKVEAKVDKVDQKIEEKVEIVENKVEKKIEDKLESVEEKIGTLKDNVESKIELVEEKVEAKSRDINIVLNDDDSDDDDFFDDFFDN